jgi:uncharacterized protein
MPTDQQRYEDTDLPFYREYIEPLLGPRILDFHAHIWHRDNWLKPPAEDSSGNPYMNTMAHYPLESIVQDTARMFPGKEYRAVCFGQPTPEANLKGTNAYALAAARRSDYFPLLICGKDLMPLEIIEHHVLEDRYYGYKVYLNWLGDDYGHVRVEDLIGDAEMQLAQKYSLIVLLHVPGARRLADPLIQAGVRRLAKDYPAARIVLAHCGRCYLPDEMRLAIPSITDLENVYLDTSMVMEPGVIEMAFREIGPERVLFGTDLPVAAMRGRRVYAMDHWVDLVTEGYPPSAYRVASDNMHATFMAYEIILAIRRAGEICGLSEAQIRNVFYENGMSLINQVIWRKS